MLRIILLSFSCLVLQTLAAQKQFFQSIELLPFVYIDDVLYSKKEIRDLYKEGHPLSGNRLDSLNSVLEKHNYINGGKGIQIRLQKIIPFFQPASRRQIEWNLGGGYRSSHFRSLSYTRYFEWDSVNTNLVEQEQFRLEQNYADLYTSLVYSISGRSTPWLKVSLGFGIQGSFALGDSRIVENYRSRKILWNGTTWEEKEKHDTTVISAAVKKTGFGWSIPLDLRFRISKKFSTGCSFEYFHRRKNPAHEKTYSEGMIFIPAIRYNL